MWPDSCETKELLLGAGDGDQGAVDRLLGRHREALAKMIGMRLDREISRRVDASDIVQEVLLEAHQRLQAYIKKPTLPFHLWLRHIARDHLIDAHRHHRVALKRSVDRETPLSQPALSGRSSVDLASQLSAGDLTPAAAAIRKELFERFESALWKMGEEDREIILMRHYEGLSNGDVARTLSLSEPAAGMRYLRGLRRLRALLDGGRSS